MTIWTVVWVVLMILWLFGYGMWHYSVNNKSMAEFTMSCLLPWLCVLILGLVVFGALSGGAIRP